MFFFSLSYALMSSFFISRSLPSPFLSAYLTMIPFTAPRDQIFREQIKDPTSLREIKWYV